MSKYIQLDRQFSPIFKNHEDAENLELSLNFGFGKADSWESLLTEHRCVVLAEAGAGKTVEFQERARLLEKEKKFSFFIRIEDIDHQFSDSFEVGDESLFNDWLVSSEEAWFFLDSVDEAQLASPRAFEKAIQRFSRGVQKGAHRAHIYISSRPYSWRAKADQMLMDTHLFIPSVSNEELELSDNEKPPSALKVYSLCPLNRGRISDYCEDREIESVEKLLNEIDRLALWNLAERPFDLDVIITKWADDNSLDGRLNLLQHNIDLRLKESHSTVRSALNADKARDGAQRLAAAVVLTGNVGINVPDSEHAKKGIDANTILYDWEPGDVKFLLESGLFNDILYDAVRFRHRDIRELLAAEFFDKLLKENRDRSQIESYFFKESLGERIATPLLRPLLPWLILFDDNIRDKTLSIKPEIAVEEGDPAQLPLPIRKRILSDIVSRIANDVNEHSVSDNTSIARIAQSDLTEETLNLIQTYHDNDDVIFFLGRLVWQGNMTSCVESLISIATNKKRNKYTRIVSIRAVMSTGIAKQKLLMWEAINNNEVISKDLLVELIAETKPTEVIIELLLRSISKLTKYTEYEYSRLSKFLFEFVERTNFKIIPKLLSGIFTYLEMTPHIERIEYLISEQYAWLVSVALKCIERLIINRDDYVFSETSLSILINVDALRYCDRDSLQELKHDLSKLVPVWKELNESLYWHTIEKTRELLNLQDSPLTDDRSIFHLEHFWNFDGTDFPRLVGFMKSRSLADDRLIALKAAYRIYLRLDTPVNMLKELRSAVEGNDFLTEQLEKLLNPIVSKSTKEFEEKEAARSLKANAKNLERENNRMNWIISLKSDPSKIANPSADNGKITRNHLCLMNELEAKSSSTTRKHYSQWQLLISNFGKEVAEAYKDFCMQHWRNYRPQLRSEEEVGNSISAPLLLALSGLEIEVAEIPDFPKYLKRDDLDMALRYLTWDINGFPTWFEKMHKAFPTETENAVLKELFWELVTPKQKGTLNHIMHDLVYYAPWLAEYIAPKILEHLLHMPSLINSSREYYVQILIEGQVKPEKLSILARKNITASQADYDGTAWWYALLVDSDPDIGIFELENWLSSLANDKAVLASEIFIVALLGGMRSKKSLYCAGRFKTAAYLKSLYILMHQYIRTNDDIDRTSQGVYSPTIRDKAQKARDMLLNYLVEQPGKESYFALKQLIEEHPEESYRPWMRKRAYKMAENHGNIVHWSALQFKEFHKSKTIPPESHRQLFDVAVQQLNTLKDWVENGNDSPWMTWQKATTENEVRTLIAGELRKHSKGLYTIAEEPELANEQRMDIWLANPNVASPVPIELKLLDKDWSGPKLCERLRNQLIGDYLREESAGYGVFLLISQKVTKKWLIEGKRIGIEELSFALKGYWKTISHNYLGIEEIEVVVIDMDKRALVCNT